MIAIAACAPNERLPVVVERLGAPGGRAMHGEGNDLVSAFAKRFVESPQGPDGVGACSPQNVSEPLLHRGAIGRGRERAVRGNRRPDRPSVLVGAFGAGLGGCASATRGERDG